MKNMKRFVAAALLIAVVILPSAVPAFYGTAAAVYTDVPKIVRIGLMFGVNTVESFAIKSSYGFEIGYIPMNGTDFIQLDAFGATSVAVSRDENLNKSAGGTYYADSAGNAVKKYHVEFTDAFSDGASMLVFAETVKSYGFADVFPAYSEGALRVRAAGFRTAEETQSYIDALAAAGMPFGMKVSVTSSKAVTVIDTATDKILFEFNSADACLGIRPIQVEGQAEDYIISPAKNQYPGIFEYRRNESGIEVINVLPIESYIKGVLPYEISTEWPDEALKVFSIVSRTFVAGVQNKHAAQGFMLCNETHCQVYNGLGRATARSNAAVDATAGIVITYNGKPIEAVYSSSMGGITENHNDAWGGTLTHPYLVSREIPFENYQDTSRNNSIWTKKAEAAALTEYLMSVSSFSSTFKSALNGSDIVSVKIVERSSPSGYAKVVEVRDSAGNTAVIRNSDNVRIAFSRYAYSANMDIYNEFKYALNGLGITTLNTRDMTVASASGTAKYASDAYDLTILTADGKKTLSQGSYNFVFDGKGNGHGVGMSQYGMYDLVMAGKGYEEIIHAFYTGVVISRSE